MTSSIYQPGPYEDDDNRHPDAPRVDYDTSSRPSAEVFARVDTQAMRDRPPYSVLTRHGVLLTQPSQTALDVEAFHRKYGFPIGDEPGFPTDEDRAMYLRLLDEEVQELKDADAEGNLIEVLDALADITYLAYGIALNHGLDLDAALRIVHASNMTKSVKRDERDKVEGEYLPPDLASLTYTEADLERTYNERSHRERNGGTE